MPAAKKKEEPASPDAEDDDNETGEAGEAEESGGQKIQLQFDVGEEQGFIKFFKNMEENQSRTIRFFYRKKDTGFYSCHGDDALFIAQECFHTMSVVKYLGRDNELAAVAVSNANFNSFVRQLLTERQYRVEVWAESKGTGKGGWSIIKQGSPGNLESFEEVIFDGIGGVSETPTAVCVQITSDGSGWKIGLAYCDNTLKVIGMSEFLDGDQLSNLEAALVRLGAKECVVGEDKMRSPVEGKKMREVLERCDVVLTERKARDFSVKDVNQDLARLLGPDATSLMQVENSSALAAAACLVKYLDLLADEGLHGRFKLRELALDGHMKLDKAAVKALNLLPQPQDGSRNMSLYSLLNKCKTPVGSRLLLRWIKQPLLDIAELEARQDLVETMVEDVQLRQGMQEMYLRHVPDLARLALKFQKQTKATLMDAWRLFQFVQQLPAMRQALEEASCGNTDLVRERLVEPLQALETDFKQYEKLVEQSLDLEGIDNHEYRISPKYSPDLQKIAEERDQVKEELEDVRVGAAKKLGLSAGMSLSFAFGCAVLRQGAMVPEDKVKMEKNKDKTYTFRITRKDEKILRNKAGSFTVVETRKDGVKFTSKELKPIAESFKRLDDEYQDTQASLVAKVMEIISTYAPAVEQLCEVVAEIDVLVALGHIAANAPTPYVRPKLTPAGQGDLVLRKARHPCVEVMDDMCFIPNDIELRRDKSRLQIITGPNMGGKSTYIRQAGVIVLMAQIGSFVPCAEAEVCITHSIHARIGAGDNQVKGVSTFMQEMLDTASILASADNRSLVIIDELGRGTSTYDGFGLAWAISEHIASEIKSPCLFATHFHELTELEGSMEAVTNRHVTAHVSDGQLTMLYEVRDGPCDQSFGIHVAEIARFPKDVVDMAKEKAKELEMFSSSRDAQDTGEEPTAKKRKVNSGDAMDMDEGEEKKGAELVVGFLKDFAAIPMGDLAPAEACGKVRELRSVLEAKQHPFVKRILAQADD